MKSDLYNINRRGFVSGMMTTLGAGLALAAPWNVLGNGENDNMLKRSTVRDCLWLWGHEAGSHDTGWNIPSQSKITPVEAASYMGIPNVIMVRYGKSALPLDKYVLPFKNLREVVWSVVGAGGSKDNDETSKVLQLPGDLPNMTGVMMDDFFKSAKSIKEAGTLSTEELTALRKRLTGSGRGLKLWVVLYDHQLDWPVKDHLEFCDKVTY